METSFGVFDRSNAQSAYSFSITLYNGPLDITWQHASATCDYVSDIIAMHCDKLKLNYNEARHSIAYLVNELLENSIKFKSEGDIELNFSFDNNNFEMIISNSITSTVAEKFQGLLAEIVSRDPGELLIERIEKNAIDENSSASGLGILTLMNDYGARMGWKFIEQRANGGILLSTIASIEVR